MRDPAPEEDASDRLFERGRFLARQEAWQNLAEDIRDAEASRAMTPDLSLSARILARGARSDAVQAARSAVSKDEPQTAHAVLSALEADLEDNPGCRVLAYVIAMAHVDLARSWLGSAKPCELPPQRRAAHAGHLRVAAQMVDRFDPFEHDSPLWASVRCAVLATDPRPAQRVADDYEDLIDLAPDCPDYMMELGRDLLPRHYGSYEALDLQARRTAARTTDLWGTGAYSWVFMGALQEDPGALRRLDSELFVEGLYDIISRYPDQHMANRLAAFTGLSLATASDDFPALKRLADCFAWIAQDHLRELHPMVWASAPMPGRPVAADSDCDRDALFRRGKSRAFSALAQNYAPVLQSGRRLVFTEDGLRMVRDS